MKACSFPPWHLRCATSWLKNSRYSAHAWIFHGEEGTGVPAFSVAIAASLLCQLPEQSIACGKCYSCNWVNKDIHPDLKRIRPALVRAKEATCYTKDVHEDLALFSNGKHSLSSKEICVPQVQEIHTWLSTTSYCGSWRIGLLYPAHSLTLKAANALLKILEEPPPLTIFLLVTRNPNQLLPTIVSRCQKLLLPNPSFQEASEWLQKQNTLFSTRSDATHEQLAASGGAPITALRTVNLGQEPFPKQIKYVLNKLVTGQTSNIADLVNSFEEVSPIQWVDSLQRLSLDLLLIINGMLPQYFPAAKSQSTQIATRVGPVRIAEMSRWLLQQRALAYHPLNSRLFVHSILQNIVLKYLK